MAHPATTLSSQPTILHGLHPVQLTVDLHLLRVPAKLVGLLQNQDWVLRIRWCAITNALTNHHCIWSVENAINFDRFQPALASSWYRSWSVNPTRCGHDL